MGHSVIFYPLESLYIHVCDNNKPQIIQWVYKNALALQYFNNLNIIIWGET